MDKKLNKIWGISSEVRALELGYVWGSGLGPLPPLNLTLNPYHILNLLNSFFLFEEPRG